MMDILCVFVYHVYSLWFCVAIKAKEAYYCITVILYYCITVLLYYCITVLLYYCITVLLYHCITVLLYYCISAGHRYLPQMSRKLSGKLSMDHIGRLAY